MNALAAALITAAHSHLLKIILKALYVRFKCDVEIDLDFYVRARACNWKNAQQSFYTSAVKYTLYVTSPRPEEVGQLSREFLDQSNCVIFYASWLRLLSRKFTQDGKNL